MACKLDIVGGGHLGPTEGWALEKMDSLPLLSFPWVQQSYLCGQCLDTYMG